jgi:hypothetical protein
MAGELGTQYMCDLCGVALSGEKAKREHLEGRLHNNKLKTLGSTIDSAEMSRKRPREDGECSWQEAVTPGAGVYQEATKLPDSALPRSLPLPPAKAELPEKQPQPEASATKGGTACRVVDVQRLRFLLDAIERGEHGDAPSVTVKVNCGESVRGRSTRIKIEVTDENE